LRMTVAGGMGGSFETGVYRASYRSYHVRVPGTGYQVPVR
jgi:hypothetical protein